MRPEAFEDLAHHYQEADDEEKARTYYTRAGERAAAAYANQEAESYFRAALDLEPSSDERAELLSSLAEVINRVGRHEESIVIWKEAVELYAELEDKDRIAWCYSRMARAKWWAGDIATAVELSKHGMELTADAPESPDLADLIHETARSYYFFGDPAPAEAFCRQALEMARRVSAKRVEADALSTLGILPNVNTKDAIAAFYEAIAICQAEKLPVEEFRAHSNLGVQLYLYEANFRTGREHYVKAAEIARQLGDLTRELFVLTNAASTSITMGEFSRAEQLIANIDEIRAQLVAPGRTEGIYKGLQADFEQAMGNLEGPTELYRVKFRQLMGSGSAYEILGESLSLSFSLLELGLWDEAEPVIQQGVKAADQIREFRVEARAVQVMVLARTGDHVQARQVYDKAEQIFAERSRAWAEVRLSMAHAHILAAEKRWEESFAAFQKSADLLERAEARFPLTIFLQDWAQAHLQRGQPGDLVRARELLREALLEFEAMGSPGYVARIQARLDELKG